MKETLITSYFDRKAETHKKCFRCKKWLKKASFGKNKSIVDGLASECKECHNRRNRRSNISDRRIRTEKLQVIKKKYGLSESMYKGRLEETGHRCPMCTKKLQTIYDKEGEVSHIDHLPGTGMIYTNKNKRKAIYSGTPSVTRGILCLHCNNTIARSKEKMTTLVRGAQYLMRWGKRYGYLDEQEITDYRWALREATIEADIMNEREWSEGRTT